MPLNSTSSARLLKILNKEHFNTVNTALRELQTQSADILAVHATLADVFDEDVYKLDGATYHKKLTRQFNGFFSRLFNAEYKQLMADLRLCRKDGKKLSYDEAVTFTEKLSSYQQKCSEFTE